MIQEFIPDLMDLVLVKEHPQGQVLKRRIIPIPPEPIKWLVSNAVDKVLGWGDAPVDKRVRRERQA